MAKLHLKDPPVEMTDEELQAVDTKSMEVGGWNVSGVPFQQQLNFFDCFVSTSCAVLLSDYFLITLCTVCSMTSLCLRRGCSR